MKNTEYIEKNFALEKADNKDHLGIFYHDEADIIIKFINSLPTVDVIPIDWIEDVDLLLGAIDVMRRISRMFGEVSVFDEKSHIEDVLLGIKSGKYEIVERKEE